MTKRMLQLCSCFLLGSPALVAQQAPSQEQKPGKIEGKIIHAGTGEPVPRANLLLVPTASPGVVVMGSGGGPPGGRSAISDAEGKFLFDGVAPGAYQLSAQRAGFLRTSYGARNVYSSGTLIRVNAGDHVVNVDFKLTPQAVIQVKVIDENGDPMEHCQVSLHRSRGSRAAPMMMQGSQTDDRGEYRFSGLPPGKYVVSASPSFRGLPEPPDATGDKPKEQYVQTYFPGVTDASGATVLEVAGGQELTGTVIPMRKSRVFRIRGKVVGAASPRVRVAIMPREPSGMVYGFNGGNSMVNPDGSFEINGVQPGSYRIIAMPANQPGPAWGHALVEVGGQNVDGVTLTSSPAINVTGTLKIEGEGAKLDVSALQLRLAPQDAVPSFIRPATPGADSKFAFEQVSREKFTLMVYPLPEGGYLKSVTMGGQDVKKSIDLSAAEGTVKLDVVVSTRAAQLEGTIARAKETDPTGVVFALPEDFVPEQGSDNRFAFRPMAPADQTGRFTFKSLAPGQYRLVAFDEFNPIEDRWTPELLKAIESRMERIELGELDRKSVTLKQIKTAELPPEVR